MPNINEFLSKFSDKDWSSFEDPITPHNALDIAKFCKYDLWNLERIYELAYWKLWYKA